MSSFPKQQFVRHAHQCTFHVVFKFGDKLYAIHEQTLEKVLADIPFISDQLAIYEFYECFVFQWFPVIHIARGYHKVQQLTPLVTYQMQLKVKEPYYVSLSSLLNALEYLVDMYSLVSAYSKGSAVHEAYASTFSEQHLLDE